MSKLIYQTYNGYVMSQFRKLQKDIENHGEIRWKHAMHLIRRTCVSRCSRRGCSGVWGCDRDTMLSLGRNP